MRTTGIVLWAAALAMLDGAVARAAGEPKRVFVMPFSNAGLPAEAAALIESACLANLGARTGLVTLSADEGAAIAKMQVDRQALGCKADQACLAELGRSAQADLVLKGSVGRLGDLAVLNLTLLNPRAGQVTGRSTVTADDGATLVERVADAVTEVLGEANAASVAPTLSDLRPNARTAVMPLANQGVPQEAGASLTQVVALELKRVRGLSVIAQDDITAMLELEMGKQLAGCGDSVCFAEIGGALGVDYLVTGSIGRIDDTYLVSLKLIAVHEARVLNRVQESFKGRESDLLGATKLAAAELVGVSDSTPGALRLWVTPESALAEVDGKQVAGPHMLGGLAPGRHNIAAAAEGHYSGYLEVYVQPGLTTSVTLELTPLPAPWYKRWWVWTAAAGVVAGGAAAFVLTRHSDSAPDTGSIGLQIERGLHDGH